jgi:hypothetical protein
MNEEALQYSYDLFKQDGYNGSIEDYKKLINEDKEALNYAFDLFSNDGYDGQVEEFNTLVGVGKLNNSVDVNLETGLETLDTDLKSKDGSSESQKILANGGIVSMYDQYINDNKDEPTNYNVDNVAGQFIIDKVAGFTSGAAGLLGGAADGVEMLADVGAQTAIDVWNYFSDDDYSKEEREAISGIIEQSFTLDDALNIAAAEAARFKTVRDDDDGVGILGAFKEGNYLEALDRTISGVFEAAPSVIAAVSGPIGLGIIGASSTGQHYEEKSQMEPESRGLAMMGVSVVQGGIELASEVVTKGIFKGVGKMAALEGKALVKSAIGRLSTAMFFEGTSEVASQEVNNVIDKIYSDGKIDKFYDKEGNFDTTNVLNRVFDTYLISAALGGGIQGGVELSGRQKALQADRMMSPNTQIQNTKLQGEITSLEEKNKGVDNSQVKDEIIRKKAQLRRKNKVNFDIVDSFSKDDKVEYLNILDQQLDLEVEAKNGDLNEQQTELNKKLHKENNGKLNEMYDAKAGELVQARKANTLSFAESAESIGIKSTKLNRRDYVSKVVKAVEAQRKAIKEDKSLSPEQKSKAIKDLPDGTPRSISEGSGAFFLGGEFFINEEMLDKIDQLNVGAHETLHPILNTIIGNAKEQGKLIEKFKKNLSKEQLDLVDLKMKDRGYSGRSYNTEYLTVFSDAIADKDIGFEENLFTKIGDYLMPLFRAVGFKKIKFESGKDVYNFMREYSKSAEKGVISKDIKDAILEKTDGKGVGSITPVKKPKSTEVLSMSKSVTELNTELEDLKDREFEMDEGDFDAQKSNLELKIRQAKKPSVKKQSSSKEKSAPKKVYDNEGLIETIKSKDPKVTGKEKALAEADLTESFDALALKAIKYDTRKGDYDRNEIKDYLREFFPRVVESFDPSKSKFSTWVTNNMAPKAQQTYEKFKKIADKSLDVEAGGVGSVKEMSGDVNTLYGSDSKPSDLKDSTQKMIKATSFGPISDPSILEAVEDVIDIKEGERPNFKSLNNKFFDKVSEAIFGISGKKARGNATLKYDKSGGSSEANSLQNVFKNDSDVRKFIKTMPDYNIATKETVVNEQGETIDVSRDTYGRSIGINPKVLAIFYDKVDGAIPGISSPNGRSLGKTTQTDVYKLKSEFTGNISPSSVAKLQSLIGINKGTLSIPIKGEARTEFGSILTGLTKMYIDNVINTVGRSKLDSNQDKADLGAGKSSLMFSKNIQEVVKEQEIINNLGLQPGSNHNSLLEIQFSKKARAEYENVLKKKRPDLKDIPKQVENLFEWANNLNIPENKKPKYKKLALYYTANGYTIFPEDGYKIEEVIRLSDKNKIDPYAYANPDELINRFTEEVRTEKINPDNVPQLSNKQEMDDGVVIYDVVDSKRGQKAVRSIVDSFWGENANPWCLIARTKERTVDSFPTEPEAKKLAEQEASWFIAYKPNMKRWFVMEPVDPKDAMTSAWTHWQQYNVDGLGEGYKIAFQNGKLLSFRDGGEGDPSMTDLGVYDYEIDPQWWDRFDSPTSDLTINLGKDKATGYKIIGSMDSKGGIDITGYGEGDFMGRKSDFSLYDADKNLIYKKVYKDGKISSSTVVEPSLMNDGGRAVVEKKSKYTDGVFSSSVSTVKDLKTGNIVTKSTNSHTYLNENYYIEEFIVVGKNGKTPTAPKVTEKNIVLISIQPNPTRDLSTEYYAERITDGVSDVVIDKMAELEDIKKSYIQLSKSVDKAAKSNNDMLPESQRLTGDFTNQDVLDRMGELDNEINEAEIQFSKKADADPKLDKEFNDIIENKTGIASDKTFASVKAALKGKKKGRFNFFIPPAAEDFVGLLYATLGKGTLGDSQMKWYKDNLLNPFAKGVANITRDRNNLGRDFKALKKDLKIVPRNLKKTAKGSDFTREQAVRVYIWHQIGKDVPGLSKADVLELVALVDSDPKLQLFAQEIMKLNKGRAYVSPSETWVTGTITTDLLEALNTTGRADYLGLWKQNVDSIFSDKNLNKLEAAYGKSYRVAMENILHRMETGRNRTYGGDTTTGRFTDWINGSTAAIMFFNTRSAALQLISAVNFIDFGDNNVIAAGKAFANQPQYWSDFKTLWNSEFLLERRDGLKININEEDIANVAKESGVRGVINKLLKLGFTPTQLADSFAIASGGSTFYRNRIKSLVKGGMNPIAANKQAMQDFREVAEESQQSSRPDKISQQQAGPLGRIILAFANTPAQYARIIKKAASDIKNGRGDKKANLSKILYYGVAQNLVFSTMQQALFALMFEDEEENESILEEKVPKVINGMVDSIARGTGLLGAVFTVVKNTSIKLYEASETKNPKYQDKILDVLRISPPIASKIQKLQSAGRTASWNMDEIKTKGFSLDNPGFLAGGNVVSAATNIPLDRAVKKLNNLKAASDSEIATYKRIALLMGWNEWELGLNKKKKKPASKSKSRRRSNRRSGPDRR